MKYPYITIEREYGSGGTKVAELLGVKTQIPVYGKQLLQLVSERAGVSVEDIQQYEEKATNSFLYSIVMMERFSKGAEGAFSGEEKIFYYEQEIIKELAWKGSGIFIGHCSAQALYGRGDVLRVFLYADDAFKRKTIEESYGIEPQSVEAVRKAFDRKRSNYFSANTGRKWMDPRNYDVMLNTGKLGLEATMETIAEMIR